MSGYLPLSSLSLRDVGSLRLRVGACVPVRGARATGYESTLGRMNLFPVFVPEPCTINKMHFNVTTAEAGIDVRLGLYTQAADGTAGVLISDGGTVSVAATGIKVVTLGVPVRLPAGIVYAAFVPQGASGGGTYRVTAVDGALYATILPPLPAGAFGGSVTRLFANGVTGALPDPAPAQTAAAGSHIVIGLEVSAVG